MKPIRNIGSYNIQSELVRSKGIIVCKDFLEKLTIEFAKQSNKCIELTSCAPFTYSEKQLHSIMAPAINSYCDNFLMELPLYREWSKLKSQDVPNSYGWIDYWVKYRKINFFIELKHSFVSYKSGKIRESSSNSWRVANNQLIGSSNLAKEYAKDSKGSFLIAFHVFTVYDSVQNLENLTSIKDSQRLVEIQQHYMAKLKPKSNWSSCILFNKNLVLNSRLEKEANIELFPGIIFMARIFKFLQ